MTDTDRLLDVGLVPILRLRDPDVALAAGLAFAEAGLRAVEVTATVPGAAEVIAKLAASVDGSEILIGAGTVLGADEAAEFVEAGARFLVSPVLDLAVVDAAARLGVPHVPAGLTPSELSAAHRAGAPLVKLYPSATVGPSYVSLLRGPLPQIPIICTGGVEPETALGFIRAGALAVGIGGRLCPQRSDEVEEAARLAATTLHEIDAERGR